ncbi:MAG: DUF695 domain-containing protein, partial [Marivirga sp.]|nr:DUF695 domain-containing protein [Marivirga sp.]
MSLLKNIFSKKDPPIKSYSDFWEWFRKYEKTFYHVVEKQKNVEKDFFDKLSPKLGELKDGFFYLTGMYDDHTAELVLTADGNVKNIVFVEELVAAAPEIPGWRFTALKPALDIKDVGIEMGGYQFNNEKLSFYSNDFPEYPDEIDITVVHKDLDEGNRDTIINGTYIFLDNFLGELNFVTTIDNSTVIGKDEIQKELVPIEKLKDFLIWRRKEFVEKHENINHSTDNDNCSILEAELQNGKPLIAAINTDLLNWDNKASHPWILSIEIKYEDENNNGMPDKLTYELLDEIEDRLT